MAASESESSEDQPLLHYASDSCCRLRAHDAVLRKNYAPCVPARYVLVVISCLGLVNVYMLRVNLSVALVQMAKDTASVTNHSARVFDWTSTEQGWVLSSFFFGYIILQIPGGWLSHKFGAKWLFGCGVLATSILTLLTPVAANLSVWALVALRVLEGFFEGVTFPALLDLWGKWAPPLERSRLTSFSYNGGSLGSVLAFLSSGLLCEYGFDGGWPSVFYVSGCMGIVWFIAWAYLAYSSPATHPRISKQEREYIETSIGDRQDDKIPVPWKEILTSGPFWGIVAAMFSFLWGFYVTITCLPTFFNQALKVKFGEGIVINGIYSAIPYIFLMIVVVISGVAADYAISKGIPIVIVRKTCSSSGLILSAFFLLICGYFGNSVATGVVYVTLSVGIMGVASPGIATNILDIAPRYAGVLMALANTISTLAGVFGPLVAKAIAVEPPYLKDSPAYLAAYRDEWREVFVLGAEIMIFGALVHLILGSGKKQPWADGPAWYRKKITTKGDSYKEKNALIQ